MPESDVREGRPSRKNRNQAVRIPVDLEMPDDRALLRNQGDRLILGPLPKAGLLGLLAQWQPKDDAFSDIADKPCRPEEILG